METTTTTTETYEERAARQAREQDEREVAALKPLARAAFALQDKLGGSWTSEYIDEPNKHWPDRREREVRLVQQVSSFLPLHYTAEYVQATRRVVVRVELPKGATWDHVGHGVSRPEATFDPERGIVGLVASIKRIAGEARIFVTNAAERREADDAYEAEVNASAARLAAVLGIKAPKRESRNGDVRLYSGHLKSVGSVEGQVYSRETTLTIRGVPTALAEKILKLIANAPAKKKED